MSSSSPPKSSLTVCGLLAVGGVEAVHRLAEYYSCFGIVQLDGDNGDDALSSLGEADGMKNGEAKPLEKQTQQCFPKGE